MADTEGRAYDAHDAQRDAPTGFRRRVNRRVTTYILMQRLGAKRLATPADQLAWRDL